MRPFECNNWPGRRRTRLIGPNYISQRRWHLARNSVYKRQKKRCANFKGSERVRHDCRCPFRLKERIGHADFYASWGLHMVTLPICLLHRYIWLFPESNYKKSAGHILFNFFHDELITEIYYRNDLSFRTLTGNVSVIWVRWGDAASLWFDVFILTDALTPISRTSLIRWDTKVNSAELEKIRSNWEAKSDGGNASLINHSRRILSCSA